MPTHPESLQEEMIGLLRNGTNPFATRVTAVGTAEESVARGVPEFTARQLADLLQIISLHREGQTATRIYPVLGERGAGKTHLIYDLRAELRARAGDVGEETLFVMLDRLSPGMDAVDYLLWQIVNHLLAQRGDGERMLRVISGRLTAKILAEALRQLGPHQRAELAPPGGFWSKIGLGGSARTQSMNEAIDKLIQHCDREHHTTEELRSACEESGLSSEQFSGLIEQHLERSESKDVLGWLRRNLYGSLARVAVADERGAFEDFHTLDFVSAPPNVKNTANLNRLLLETWLELLRELRIPVVLVLDQLEDYLRSPIPEEERQVRKFFTDSIARLTNELKTVCILVFAERLLWTDLINDQDAYTRERLSQQIPLPGRPAVPHILMPDRVSVEMLRRLVRTRMIAQFPAIDGTELGESFPFSNADLEKILNETTVRECLRRLAQRYDEIVFADPPKIDFRSQLQARWVEFVSASSDKLGNDMSFRVPFIPEVQTAIQTWIDCLARCLITGSAPWAKTELITDTNKAAYGYLNVIRTDSPGAPGIGIAAWLGTRQAQPNELRKRLEFFADKPAPIKTLVLLRADGEDALSAPTTREIYEQAKKKGRDVRIVKFEPRQLHALMAFGSWWNAVNDDLSSIRDTNSLAAASAEKALRDFLAEISKELIAWIDEWREPTTRAKADLIGVGG